MSETETKQRRTYTVRGVIENAIEIPAKKGRVVGFRFNRGEKGTLACISFNAMVDTVLGLNGQSANFYGVYQQRGFTGKNNEKRTVTEFRALGLATPRAAKPASDAEPASASDTSDAAIAECEALQDEHSMQTYS